MNPMRFVIAKLDFVTFLLLTAYSTFRGGLLVVYPCGLYSKVGRIYKHDKKSL
jgi:hypothetical protein